MNALTSGRDVETHLCKGPLGLCIYLGIHFLGRRKGDGKAGWGKVRKQEPKTPQRPGEERAPRNFNERQVLNLVVDNKNRNALGPVWGAILRKGPVAFHVACPGSLALTVAQKKMQQGNDVLGSKGLRKDSSPS